jgi:hypothetical protein
LLALTAATLAATTLVPGTDRVAAQSAGNGLEEQSVNSFEFDPSRGVVRVTVDISLRNVTTDQVEDNGVRRTFFDGYVVAVPLGAENIVAVRNGAVLEGTLVSDPAFPAFSSYRFPLGTQLFSGDSTSVQVTYDHLGAPPRDPVPWRINEAYAGFVAFGLGDDGLVTLRISQPSGYEFDEFTDLTAFDVSDPDEFGTVVYTRAGLSEDVQITVGLANDDRLVLRPLAVDDVDIGLRSWPDDPEWADFAAVAVESGIPALEDLIGSSWPVEGSFSVRQTVEPNLRGYAGWFDAQSSEIAVGEALDADTIYHELSHAWFNGRMSTERWLTEGLAQVYAAELVRLDGDSPRVPVEPAADDPGAVVLTEWGDVGSERTVEEYGYATSFWVLDALVDEIGFDRTREVVAALDAGTSPYDETVQGDRPAQEWQRVHDTFVEVARSTTVGDMFRTWVVGPDDVALIDRRDGAVDEVAGLTERSAPWALPVGVRQVLERWELDAVDDAVDHADEVLELRADLEDIEAAVGIDEPDGADDAYAAAPRLAGGGVDFAEPMALLGEALSSGRRLLDRQADIDELADRASASPAPLASIDGVADFASGIDAADLQIEALERIIEVDEALDAQSGVLAAIGRWGSDIERTLESARDEVAVGDSAAAVAALASADEEIDGLVASGALRVMIAACLVVLVAAIALVVRRRRRNLEETELKPR